MVYITIQSPIQLDSASSKDYKLDPQKGATGLSVEPDVHYNKWTFEKALSRGGQRSAHPYLRSPRNKFRPSSYE